MRLVLFESYVLCVLMVEDMCFVANVMLSLNECDELTPCLVQPDGVFVLFCNLYSQCAEYWINPDP